MKRRNFVYATATGSAALALAVPAIAQGMRELKMVTSWPKGLPGLGTSAERMAKAIGVVTGGKIQVKVFGAGEMVKPFEVFDAVSAGVADIYHSCEYYFDARSPGLNFFTGVPFGFTADELAAWIHFGGGQALWDEISAGFNLKGLLCANTGVQMGGWFNKEVSGPESYKGLRYRMPGLGGEVLRRLGAVVVALPGGEIAAALQSGAIDASEWVGPWNDMVLGLHKVSKFYYYPGFHEPGTSFSTTFNKSVWDSFSAEERGLISMAANAEYTISLAEFNANNAKGLQELKQDKAIEIRRFDDALLRELGTISQAVVAEVGTKDPTSRRVFESYMAFRAQATPWSDVAERGFLNARNLTLDAKG
jgi:TRAP-type mannitol/chloroaromatic compound transport system substrate-binding protein